MGKTIAAAVTLVAVVFLAGLLAPAVSAAPTEEPVGWEKGDKWALGWDKSFSAKNNGTINAGLAWLVSEATGMDFEKAKVDISVGAAVYMLFEVTDVTDDTYEISTKMAVKLEADAKVSLSGKLPKAGTYQDPAPDNYVDLFDDDEYLDYAEAGSSWFNWSGTDLSFIPEEDRAGKTVSAVLGADFAFVLEGTITFNKSLAVEKTELSAKASAVMSLNTKNLPMIDRDDDGQVTIAYRNHDVDAKLVLTLDMEVLFGPQPVDLFGLDIHDGKEWDVNTNATVTGEIGGFIDLEGLPQDMERYLLETGFLKEANITGFPINFIDLIPEDSKLSNGEFGPIEQNISAHFRAEEHDGIYEITTGEGVAYYYDPESKFLSGLGLSGGLDLGLSMDDSAFLPFLEPVDPEDAEDEIKAISSYQKDVEKRAGNDNVTDFFFDPPYFGLILVVVAAVVVGGALFMVTRARKQ